MSDPLKQADQIHDDDLDWELISLVDLRCLNEWFSRAAAEVQPGEGAFAGGSWREITEWVETQFPVVPIGAEQVTFAVHPTVGDNG